MTIATLERFAGSAVAQGEVERAARLPAAAAGFRAANGAQPAVAEQQEFERDMSAAREALDEDAFVAARQDGGAMTWKQAAAFARGQERPGPDPWLLPFAARLRHLRPFVAGSHASGGTGDQRHEPGARRRRRDTSPPIRGPPGSPAAAPGSQAGNNLPVPVTFERPGISHGLLEVGMGLDLAAVPQLLPGPETTRGPEVTARSGGGSPHSG